MIGDRQTGDTSRDIQIGIQQGDGGDRKRTVPDRQTDRQKVDKQRNRKTNIQGPT
jgi:hypothetical protein